MIDRRVFDREFAVLAEMYRMDVSVPLADRYFELLSPRMTTSQFIDACRRLAVTDDAAFWPRPSAFLPDKRQRLDGQTLLNVAKNEGLIGGPTARAQLGRGS